MYNLILQNVRILGKPSIYIYIYIINCSGQKLKCRGFIVVLDAGLDKARSFHLTQSNLHASDFLLLCFPLSSLESHFQTLKIGLFLNTKSDFVSFGECCERSEDDIKTVTRTLFSISQ